MFCRFKLKFDPMFKELPGLLSGSKEPSLILDIGSGLGVPACLLLEMFPHAQVFGLEPAPESQRISNMAVTGQGYIELGAAPDLPAVPEPVDIALMIDMSHFLTLSQFRTTLQRIRKVMAPGATLVIRAIIPPAAKPSFVWPIEELKLKIKGITPHYLSVMEITDLINETQFNLEFTRISGDNPETVWFIAKGNQ